MLLFLSIIDQTIFTPCATRKRPRLP